jgi:hypothetical protein
MNGGRGSQWFSEVAMRLLVVVTFVVASCGGEAPEACGSAPCADGTTCQSGTCVASCTQGSCGDAICDERNGRCVECRSDDDCSTGALCNVASQRCLTPSNDCSSDADCAGRRCDVSKAACVDCVNDADCAAGRCDVNSNTCVVDAGCATDDDCSSGVCSPQQRTCVECYLPVHCATGQCDFVTSTCVGACRDDDETEDNDDGTGGTPVSLGAGGEHQGAICGDDIDVVTATTTAGLLTVELLVQDPSAFRMTVAGDGVNLGSPSTTSTGLQLQVSAESGFKRVVVSGVGSNGGGEYRVRIRTEAEGCQELDAEPNNNAASASALTLDNNNVAGALCGDDDVWQFTVQAGDEVAINAVKTGGDGTLAARIEDGAGTIVVSGSVLAFTATAATSYYVRLSSVQDLTYSLRGSRNEQPACDQQDAEPNNTNADATFLLNGGTRGGTICDGDVDHWVFSANANDDVRVTVNDIDGLRVRLLNSAGTTLATGTTINVADLAAGTHYVVVDGATTDYNISLGLVPEPSNNVCDEGGAEPDGIDSPRSLPTNGAEVSGNICTDGDLDVFAIDVAFATELAVTARFVDVDGDIDIQLLDASGAELARSAGVTDDETIRREVTPGRYYLQVFGFLGATNLYRVSATLSGCRPEDGFEDNNTAITATPLRAGVFQAVRCPGNDDFYALSLQNGDTVALSASGVALSVLTLAGDVVAQTGDGSVINLNNIATGTYVVRVSGSSPNRIEYALSVDVVGAGGRCVDDGAAPNQSPATAMVIDDAGFADGSYDLSTLMSCSGATDHYLVDLPGQKQVTFRLNHDVADLDVEVLEERGSSGLFRQLARAFGTTTLDDARGVMNVGGRVLLKVPGFAVPAAGAAYGLGIEVTTPPNVTCQNDRFDDFSASDDEVRRTYNNNDDVDTDGNANIFTRPTELVPGENLPSLQICNTDQDWFVVPGTAGGTMTVTVTYAHALGADIDMRVYGPDGADVDTAIDLLACPNLGCNGTDGTETLTFPTTAGTYTIEVFGFSGSVNSYALQVQ